MFSEELPSEADVVIIGAGVVGLAIARELSKFDAEIVVLEKECDVGLGLTSRNMGVVHPFIPQSGTIKFELCLEGNRMFDELSDQLSFPFKRVGLLIVALTFFESLFLRVIKVWLRMHGIKYEHVDKIKLRELEPDIVEEAKSAIFVPTAGIVDPVEFTIALAENASSNGVKIVLNCFVEEISVEDDKVKLRTSKGDIKADFVINAAGLQSDILMKLAGDEPFEIAPGLGVMIIFDSMRKIRQRHLVAEVPLRVDPRTKGGAAGITVYGDLIWGPNLRDISCRNCDNIVREDIDSILSKFGKLYPGITEDQILFYFSGVRPASKDGDFIIKESGGGRVIHVAGIQSPGLTAAPAIARRVVELLKRNGFRLKEKGDFNPFRDPIKKIREASDLEVEGLLELNMGYGNVICNEVPITEGEVLEAIKRGARTVKGVLNRLGLSWHPVIQSECSVKIAEILARELGKKMNEITFEGAGTELGWIG